MDLSCIFLAVPFEIKPHLIESNSIFCISYNQIAVQTTGKIDLKKIDLYVVFHCTVLNPSLLGYISNPAIGIDATLYLNQFTQKSV